MLGDADRAVAAMQGGRDLSIAQALEPEIEEVAVGLLQAVLAEPVQFPEPLGPQRQGFRRGVGVREVGGIVQGEMDDPPRPVAVGNHVTGNREQPPCEAVGIATGVEGGDAFRKIACVASSPLPGLGAGGR